jgi:hypothetical protein
MHFLNEIALLIFIKKKKKKFIIPLINEEGCKGKG